MAWLILNDEIDYASSWYPTHIVGKDGDVYPVHIGAPSVINDKFVGIYVADRYYDLIRHDKAYVFIHDPDVTQDDIDEIEWDKIADVEDQKTVGRKHVHVWKEMEYGGSV